MKTSKDNNLTRIPWQAFVAAAALLPSVGVLGARTLLPSRGPQSAVASQATAGMPSPSTLRSSNASLTSAPDITFLQHVAATAAKPVERSPIIQRIGKSARAEQPQNPSPKSYADEPALRSTESSVTSILKSNGQMIAMIGSKLRRVGDHLSDGWSVKNIDADEGTVLLVHVSGYTKSLSLRKKQ